MRKGLFYLLILASVFTSCNMVTDAVEETNLDNAETEAECSPEFITVGIQVYGADLEEFYTVRESTGEIINIDYQFGYPNLRWYTVLDDSYIHLITNSQETFKFVGKMNGEVVVNETFQIRGDNCHVHKVSGATPVSY